MFHNLGTEMWFWDNHNSDLLFHSQSQKTGNLGQSNTHDNHQTHAVSTVQVTMGKKSAVSSITGFM